MRDRASVVSARVVRDDYPVIERKVRFEVSEERVEVAAKRVLLVVDGNRDLDCLKVGVHGHS